MSSDLKSILNLEVPIIVLLGERSMKLSEVLILAPGAIIELPKKAEDELTLRVNNKAVGTGIAVKVGENFGIKLTYIGDLKERIQALGTLAAKPETEDSSAEALAGAAAAGRV
jgi:flagellar motor switch protein FliN/FliY